MCGLFGFCGDPKAIDQNMTKAIIAKIKILGLYNIERGKHSCGILADNVLIKGTDKEKLFSDLISNTEIPDFTQSGNFVVIGHTRQATHGAHTEGNAHPFMVDDNFVLAHNGVIRNVWPMCTKYGINHTAIHVDSLGLAELINQEGFKILNEYEGFAALLMTRLSEPNSIYVYRGMSKRTSNGEMEEERPMYYMQTEEGVYFSSLERSLLAISDAATDKIKLLEGNIVHKFTNGKMTKSKFPVDRTNKVSYATTTYGTTYNSGVRTSNWQGGSVNSPAALPPTQGVGTTTPTTATTTTPSGTNNAKVLPIVTVPNGKPTTDKLISSIWHEILPARVSRFAKGCGVIFHLGRYWIVESDEIRIANGTHYINKKGRISTFKARGTIKYFFYEGVMLRNEKCFMAALKDEDLRDDRLNFASTISKYADHPVSNTRADSIQRCKNVTNWYITRWYLNGNMLQNHGFTPRFSDRNYTIHNSLMDNITCNTKAEIGPFIDKESFKAEVMNGILSNDPPAKAVQVAIPFEAEEDWDVERFYRTWESIEQARSTFSELEINALRYFVADVMRTEMDINAESIFEDAVDVQLNMFISSCIETGTSIHDNWDEANYNDIADYLMVARDNPDGKVYFDHDNNEDVEEESTSIAEVCEFVPKPIVTEKSIAETLSDLEEAKNDKNFMIDDATKADQPSVPKEEKEEDEEVDESAKNYAVEDIVDFSCEMRSCADELQAMESDDFAQEVASEIYRTVDPFIHKLRDIAIRHEEGDLQNYINKNIKERIGL